ncbi:hypothetical protein [Bdellovibrio sp. NC01]|uniref:hypothetical protein n=1 Tax=Bdellovibrio sp. NC01 TaxID=2220073 RepID=UPI001159A661|nr:hypothetical protein [Bdellovibrio sp. NC01]QDK37951.1 hypothetical protein DOE51_10310 [Bdellovibrio sp. NC01]
MSPLNIKSLITLIQKDRKQIGKDEAALVQVMHKRGYPYGDDEDEARNDYYLDLQEASYHASIQHKINFLINAVISCLDLLQLNANRDRFIKNVEQLRNSKNEFELEFNADYDVFDCKAVDIIDNEIKIISSLLGDNETGFESITHSPIRGILLGQLEQTPFYLEKLSPNPKDELEIQNVMHSVLEGNFGKDFIKRPSINQAFKTYIPDGGIKSIATAIEFKFIDSERELKTAMEGLYADFHGYSDSKDWNNFISIFYMTSNFKSPRTIKEEIEEKTMKRWTALVFTGNGGRIKTTKSIVPTSLKTKNKK